MGAKVKERDPFLPAFGVGGNLGNKEKVPWLEIGNSCRILRLFGACLPYIHSWVGNFPFFSSWRSPMARIRPRSLFASVFFLSGIGLLAASPFQGPRARYKVLAWNDLGMHCMDSDYSVFSILPPFNTVRAQVLDPNGKLVKTPGTLKVTYEAVKDPRGSINPSSQGKTNFWQFSKSLYGGPSTPDKGLKGFDMPGPSNTPQAMTHIPAEKLFHAEGIPLTPYDQGRHKRNYPMFRISVRDANGGVLGSTDTVLPISDEMDCSLCHGSGSLPAAQPKAGWVHDSNFDRDYRLNILRLHDEKQAGKTKFKTALKNAGYSAKGLYDTVVTNHKPILCASCHLSNALPGTGMPGIPALTTALHGKHAKVIDPLTGKSMDSSTNRSSCYRCHPGSETRCLRGAMGGAVASNGQLAMQCQDCHGNMSKVADPNRQGWLQEPSCQNCHTGTATVNNGQIRYTNAFDANGNLRVPADRTFATNNDVPMKGLNLYRFSKGHKGLQCEACHGSTHSVYPSTHGNDNIQNKNFQGHEGTISDCLACHTSTPKTATGGPHGMHPVGSWWVKKHGDYAEHGRYTACAKCHGTNYRGTVLSRAQGNRTFSTKFGVKTFFRGSLIGCYACHNGPKEDKRNPNRPPVAKSGQAKTGMQPVTVTLVASDPDSNPLTYRIVKQAQFGRVAIQGNKATYYPDPGFAGVDSFSWAARDGQIDSNLATIQVTRTAFAGSFGRSYPRDRKSPKLLALNKPTIGRTFQVQLSNPVGKATFHILVGSSEHTSLNTPFGGQLLVEPTYLQVLPVGANGSTLSWAIPNQASLIGTKLSFQSLVADSGTRFGFGFTQGLDVALGGL